MKTSNIIILCLIGLLVGAVIWALVERNGKIVSTVAAKAGTVLANPSAKEIKSSIDSLKQNHTSYDVTANKIDGKLVAVSKSVVDTISKLSGVKPAQVTNWQEIALSSQAQLLQATKRVDSLQNVVYDYQGQYISLSYKPAKAGDTAAGSFGYKYAAKVTATTYTSGASVFGLPLGLQQSTTDIYGNDPNMTINGLRTLQIVPKPQAFSLNAYVFSNYSFHNGNVQLGTAAQVRTGRVTVNGGYYYNTKDFDGFNKPRPFVGAKLSLFNQ